MAISKPKPKKSKRDDRILRTFLAVISHSSAHGHESGLLDNLAQSSPWARSWPEMFETLPKFQTRMNFSSTNIKALASGCGLFHSATQDAARESWLNAANLERTVGFEMEEPGSRIYGAWSLMGRLIGYRYAVQSGDTELFNYFSSWLALWWKSRQLSMLILPDGPMSLRCGARSQGVYGRTVADYADSIAFSIPWKWRRKPHPLPDQYLKRSDETVSFDNLRVEIAVSYTPSIGNSSYSWPIIAPINYYRTLQGLAVWCERADINGNTPGISAMISWDNTDNLICCPNPPADRKTAGAHKRQTRVPQSIMLSTDPVGSQRRVLSFTQSAPGIIENRTVPLPDGGLIYHIRHGAAGLETVK